ncbi:hypothetical protein CYPRO_0655 [Cyclonatronum proteinivorum]|uniref:Uncharacterized protein n=1 Tax=Cyclonatronum proteinivorum TaxID=1457365 RepID=A0A345UHI7_9BACT|nr:hypothetical protein [Cyclonatronum proteinivorum]AXI99938.1 hypothetical protein CYPRO_0655 [Cyclonatronum proteinivorum]
MNTKTALLRILSNSTDVAATKWLYELAVNIGVVYIRHRVRKGSIDLDFLHSDEMYVAQTSVAELFARDDENKFKCLCGCELLQNIEQSALQDVEIQFKRVVVTKVRDGIYLLYKQHDAQLNRILRNLKTSFANFSDLNISDTGIVHFANSNENKETIPEQILERIIVNAANSTVNTPQLLAKLVESFNRYQEYNISINLTELAILIRSAAYSIGNVSNNFSIGTEEIAEAECLKAVIEKAIKKIKKRYKPGYVEKKKMPDWLFESYLSSIKNLYLAKLTNGDSAEGSIFYYLKEEIPNLKNEEYRDGHRVTVEYLIKLSREQILADYRKI